MGCHQSDTVVSTESSVSGGFSSFQTFSVPAGDDHPRALIGGDTQDTTLVALASLAPRPPTVWTAQSLSLDVLPGSPAPQRPVIESAPAPVVVPEFKSVPARVAPATASAPATATAPATTSAPTTTAAPVTTAAPPTTSAPPTIAVAPAAAADLAARLNGVRGGRGLAPLAREASLDGAATGWARELATSGVLRHSSLPDQLIGKPWSTVGENVGFGASSAVVHEALVNSAGHLANITGASYSRIGVGAYTDTTGRLWIVQIFAG